MMGTNFNEMKLAGNGLIEAGKVLFRFFFTLIAAMASAVAVFYKLSGYIKNVNQLNFVRLKK